MTVVKVRIQVIHQIYAPTKLQCGFLLNRFRIYIFKEIAKFHENEVNRYLVYRDVNIPELYTI